MIIDLESDSSSFFEKTLNLNEEGKNVSGNAELCRIFNN